jgi:DNA invertase Pin-like site-specific DNA recombinase
MLCLGMSKKARFIAYYRVSTVKQGQSGLGIEAQEAAVVNYAAATGSQILATYHEIESGKRSDRPQLDLALAHAKRAKATLIIAKLDRLARNVEFIAHLMNAGVDFFACDLPGANRMTLHIMAAMAENEALMASERTKAGIAALKARGLYSTRLGRTVTLGAPRHLTRAGTLKGSARGVAVRKAKKAEAYAHVQPIIRELREQGLSFDAIAKELNALGHETRSQRPWHAAQVRRVSFMPMPAENQSLPFRLAA